MAFAQSLIVALTAAAASAQEQPATPSTKVNCPPPVVVDGCTLSLLDLKAEASLDGFRSKLETSILITMSVSHPADIEAIGVRGEILLDRLEDQNGTDLLSSLVLSAERLGRFPDHPFATSYRTRDPEGKVVLRKTASLYGKNIPRVPSSLARMSGKVLVLIPEEIESFDVFLPTKAEDRGVLKELTPGLWLCVDDLKIEKDQTTTGYRCWLCNRVPPDLAHKPEIGKQINLRYLRLPPEPADTVIGHDPEQPPAIVGIYEILTRGGADGPGTFNWMDNVRRRSGIYSEFRQEMNHMPHVERAGVRVRVARKLRRIEIPFDFRDVPLSFNPSPSIPVPGTEHR